MEQTKEHKERQQGRSPQEGSNRETEIPYRSENDGSRLLPPADTIA